MSELDSTLPPLTPEARAAMNTWSKDDQSVQPETEAVIDIEPKPQETSEQIAQTQEVISESVNESNHDRNFKILREKAALADKLAREHEAAMQKIREYEQMYQTQKQAQEPVDSDEIEIAPDDLAEGKHLNKLGKKLRKMEEQLKAYQRQSADMTAEARLRAEFPDFDSVVTADNLTTLRTLNPEIAETIQYSPDLYKKAVTAYKIIKNMGIDKQESYIINKERAEKNIAKPRPLASVSPQHGESPLSKANAFANGLTPELQKQLRREMEEARKSI